MRSPLWIASAHYSHKASVIKAWKSISPAALTLKTSHINKEIEAKATIRQKTNIILPRFGKSLYVDGPKQDELLSYLETQELLRCASHELPNTVVGISVLADEREDYEQLCELCESAKFCELNLKYSFRSSDGEQGNDLDQFQILKHRFEVVLREIVRFCKAFSAIPVFIKISRELSWLPGTDELRQIVGVLKNHGKAGIIIANSLKMDIAPFLAEGTEQDFKGGVICGERLFDETVVLLNKFRKVCKEAGIPVVATGGMVSPEQILTAFRAGAEAVQMCTAFDYHKLNFYSTVSWYLQNQTEARGIRSFSEYVERLRGEGIASVYSTPFVYYENFNSDELQKRLQIDVRRSSRMDIFVMSGKSLFSRWAEPFKSRFGNNMTIRVLLPRTDGPMYQAIQGAWGLNEHELQVRKERVVGAEKDLLRMWRENAVPREGVTLEAPPRVFHTDQCPFYSFYLFDDKAYIAPYPFTRPGELNSPVYVFSIGSSEYARVSDEAARLFSFASQASGENAFAVDPDKN